MITFDNRQNTLTLSTQSTTYQMKADEKGVLLHTYYGPRLRGDDLSFRICREDRGFSPNPYEADRDRTYSLDTQAPGVLLLRCGRFPHPVFGMCPG